MIEDTVREAYQNQIVELYVQFIEKKHKDPTAKEFTEVLTFGETAHGVGISSWKDVFKNISEVRGSTS